MIRLFLQPRGFLRRCLRLNPKILFAVSFGVILADASAERFSPRPTGAVVFSDTVALALASPNVERSSGVRRAGSSREIAGSNPASTIRGSAPKRISTIFAGESAVKLKTTRSASNRQILSKFAMIESSNRPLTIGDGGAARGAHQLHLAAVLDCGGTRADFIALTNRAVSDKFAGAYLNLIQTKLANAGIKQASPAQLYMVWNGGFTNAKRRGFNPANAPRITRNAIAKL